MSAFANIVINDADAAARTFKPNAIDSNGVAHFYRDETATFDDREHISLGVRLPKNGSLVSRVTIKVVMPVMDTSTDPDSKVGEVIFNGEFVLPKRATYAQRVHCLAYAKNFLANANVTAALQQLESVY